MFYFNDFSHILHFFQKHWISIWYHLASPWGSHTAGFMTTDSLRFLLSENVFIFPFLGGGLIYWGMIYVQQTASIWTIRIVLAGSELIWTQTVSSVAGSSWNSLVLVAWCVLYSRVLYRCAQYLGCWHAALGFPSIALQSCISSHFLAAGVTCFVLRFLNQHLCSSLTELQVSAGPNS